MEESKTMSKSLVSKSESESKSSKNGLESRLDFYKSACTIVTSYSGQNSCINRL